MEKMDYLSVDQVQKMQEIDIKDEILYNYFFFEILV